MPWSAEVLSTDVSRRVAAIRFTESVSGETYTQDFTVPFGASPSFVPDAVRDTIAGLVARATAHVAVVVGPIAPSPIPPPPPPESAVHAAFRADFLRLKQMQVAINHGLKLATDVDFVALTAALKATFAANQGVLLDLMREGT